MADWKDTSRDAQRLGSVPRAGGDVAGRVGYDEGLRKHMLSIYNYMSSGVLLTGIVALLFVNSPLFGMAFATVATPAGIQVQPLGLGWLIMLSPLAVMLFWWFGAKRACTWRAAGSVLGVCRAVRTVAVDHFRDLHRHINRDRVLLTRLLLPGCRLGLHNQDEFGLGSFLIMGVIGLIVAGCSTRSCSSQARWRW